MFAQTGWEECDIPLCHTLPTGQESPLGVNTGCRKRLCAAAVVKLSPGGGLPQAWDCQAEYLEPSLLQARPSFVRKSLLRHPLSPEP